MHQLACWIRTHGETYLLTPQGDPVTTADNQVLLGGPVTSSNGDGNFGIGGQLLAGFGATYYFR